MGRTVPTFRELIEQVAARWLKFRRALRREDQEHFDRLFRHARCYTQAATYQCSDNPMEVVLLSIALDQEKRLDFLERTLGQKARSHETSRMDFRSLPEPVGNESMADNSKPGSPQTD